MRNADTCGDASPAFLVSIKAHPFARPNKRTRKRFQTDRRSSNFNECHRKALKAGLSGRNRAGRHFQKELQEEEISNEEQGTGWE